MTASSHVAQHFEIDIVRHANIARGLHRYRRGFDYRRHQLPHWTCGDDAANSQPVGNPGACRSAACNVILTTAHMRRLTYWRPYRKACIDWDLTPACQSIWRAIRVLEELEQMRAALPGRRLRMSWREFRAWFGPQTRTA